MESRLVSFQVAAISFAISARAWPASCRYSKAGANGDCCFASAGTAVNGEQSCETLSVCHIEAFIRVWWKGYRLYVL